MKKLYLFLLLLSFYHLSLYSQSIEWQKSYGGSRFDMARCIRQTHDGGYIIAGSAFSNDGDVTFLHGSAWTDFWIVKIDSSGVIQWDKSLGGTESEQAYSIEETDDRGYIIAGYTQSTNGDVTVNHGGGDYWIVKIDSSGSIKWQKALGGSGGEVANCIKQTNDKGYIIAGYSNSNDGDVSNNHGGDDYWIVKLDSIGSMQWQKTLGDSLDDDATSIQQTTDGGYIVVGNSNSKGGEVTGNHGNNDYWIVKLNNIGTIQWQRSFGGSYSDYANSIEQTADKGYIIAGTTSSSDGDITGYHGNNDCWIVKLDSTGTMQWQKTLGGSSGDDGIDIQKTNDGGYIVACITLSNDGDVIGNHGAWDYWIVKLNSSGNIQWQKTLGGSSNDEIVSIQQVNNNNFILAGLTESSDGDVTSNHGLADYWIVKLSATVGIESYQANTGISVYPNPASDKISLKIPKQFGQIKTLEIYDYIGQLKLKRTDNYSEVDISSLTNGLYFIVLTNKDNERQIIKIIKE